MQCFAKHPELDLVESSIYFTSSGEPCNVMVFSYPLYMHVYVPVYLKYLDVKKKLGLDR